MKHTTIATPAQRRAPRRAWIDRIGRLDAQAAQQLERAARRPRLPLPEARELQPHELTADERAWFAAAAKREQAA